MTIVELRERVMALDAIYQPYTPGCAERTWVDRDQVLTLIDELRDPLVGLAERGIWSGQDVTDIRDELRRVAG